VLLSKRTEERLDKRIRELTPRVRGDRLTRCIQGIHVSLVGWIGFFWICTHGVEQALQKRDAHIRRRLRAIQLTHWKRKRTIVRKLVQLGAKPKTARLHVHEKHRSLWPLSRSAVTQRALPNALFAAQGLFSLEELWKVKARHLIAPVQLLLPLG
jgi:RNA-directed DNA polymerase